MRYLLVTILMIVSACLADGQSTNGVPPLKVKHHQWEAVHGQTHYEDRFYRGDQLIMRALKFQNEHTQKWEIWRFYYIDDKWVMLEDDPGSGEPVTVSLIRNGATYDAFKRQSDGTVTPLSSEELAKIMAREKELGSDYKDTR
jgi:hypothetical protein